MIGFFSAVTEDSAKHARLKKPLIAILRLSCCPTRLRVVKSVSETITMWFLYLVPENPRTAHLARSWSGNPLAMGIASIVGRIPSNLETMFKGYAGHYPVY
jgi:hypothetical protein